jgi:spore coat polysaccharide biosynthesis protein SpsF
MPTPPPRVLALIQARLGSSRLPGKSQLPLPLSATGDEQTILGHVVGRARRAASVSEVVVATTTQPLDDSLAALAEPAEVVVRLTADNPAIDPAFLDAAVAYHLSTGADYTYTSGLPLGTNIEVLSASALQRAHAEATQPDEREHVTPYLRRHPELLQLETLALTVPAVVASLRLTVDYPSDYAFVSLLFSELGRNFSLTDPAGLSALLARYPWLAAINAENVQR